MTREEAIELLVNATYSDEWQGNDDLQTAHNMAIEALKQEPCDDAISRQAVLDAIDVKAWEFCDYLISKNRNDEQKPVSHFADNLRECIREEIPSVKPQEQKTGHWIKHEQNGIGHIECSKCFAWFLESHLLRNSYCPNCGCRMKGEDE